MTTLGALTSLEIILQRDNVQHGKWLVAGYEHDILPNHLDGLDVPSLPNPSYDKKKAHEHHGQHTYNYANGLGE